MLSLSRYRLILLAAIFPLACGNGENDPGTTGGSAGEPNLPCEPEALYGLGYEAKVALCDQVTSCYGPGEGDYSCYLPAGSSDGGVGITVGDKAPPDAVLDQVACMCQSNPDAISAYTRCSQQADESLRKCIATCPDDPGACADEYVITCSQLRQDMNSLMQVGGDCYQGPPRIEMGGAGNDDPSNGGAGNGGAGSE